MKCLVDNLIVYIVKINIDHSITSDLSNRSTVPKGRYQYEVADDDESQGDPTRVKKGIMGLITVNIECLIDHLFIYIVQIDVDHSIASLSAKILATSSSLNRLNWSAVMPC